MVRWSIGVTSMPTLSSVFDSAIDQWRKEMTYPWFQLKYKLCHANLIKHIDTSRSLRILDAGGGNGIESIPFAKQGHQVDLVDYAAEMLGDARKAIEEQGLQAQVNLHQADLSQLPTLFAPESFDLLLCHNVLSYVDDVPTRLAEFATFLKPGGVASIVNVNRYSRTLATAFFRNDLTTALAEIDQRTFPTIVFKSTMTLFSAQEMSEMLTSQGLQVEQDYGILCIFSYWGDNERKSDPINLAHLEQIEFAMTDKHPYKLMASYYQILARK